jgi:hypothetical protein
MKEAGVQRLMATWNWAGFLDCYPIAVVGTAEGYREFDDRHRWEAAKRLGLVAVLVRLYEGLSCDEEWRLGFFANEAHTAVLWQTFVDHGELV